MLDNTATSALASARTFLFVPANRPERYAKALASGADAVIVDLEDAIAPSEKQSARQSLLQAAASLEAAQCSRLLVRINAAGTAWQADDLAALRILAAQGIGAVMVPKAESAATLAEVAAALGPAGALLPLIESVAGLDAIDTLAAHPQVLRLVFGHLDFQADAGLACGVDESELVPVRLALVMASRRVALAAPIDGISPGTEDMAQIGLDAARSRRGGFGGKLCIHPAQVGMVNAAFTPSAEELSWARRVIDAFQAAGGGVFSLDGRMVDAPVLRLAQRTMAQSRRN